MSILEVLLERYLSREDIQQLARDRGLPTGRTKAGLIELLLSRHFDPADALAFLKVTALRDLCREFGMDRTGDRETLELRLLNAIHKETPLWSRLPEVLTPAPDDEVEDAGGRVPRDLGTAGPWTAISIIAGLALVVTFALAESAYGVLWGGAASLFVAVVVAAVLLRTEDWWHPKVDSLRRRPED